TDTTMNHIPYKGSGPALTDVLGGQVDAICDQTTSSLQHVRAGKLRALAVAAPQRLPELPDVPTFAEAGLPDVNSMAWYGIMAPGGTLQPILDKVNQAVNDMLKDEQLRKALAATGSLPLGGTQAKFQEDIREEIARVEKVIKARSIAVQGQ